MRDFGVGGGLGIEGLEADGFGVSGVHFLPLGGVVGIGVGGKKFEFQGYQKG